MAYFDPKIWRPIPGFSKYVCDKDGHVANRRTGCHLTPYHLGSRRLKSGERSGTWGYDLQRDTFKGSQRVHMSILQLLDLVWPDLDNGTLELDGKVYVALTYAAPGYYISQDGDIINRRYNMRHIAQEVHKDGTASVRLTVNGLQAIFDVDTLIHEAW